MVGNAHAPSALNVQQQELNMPSSMTSADNDMSFKSLGNTSGLSSSQRSEADDGGHFQDLNMNNNAMKQYQETERQKSLFQNLIHSK